MIRISQAARRWTGMALGRARLHANSKGAVERPGRNPNRNHAQH
jgi:hypothetical protein